MKGSLSEIDLKEAFGLSPRAVEAVEEAAGSLAAQFARADKKAEKNQYKVLAAMQKNRLGESHLAPTTGYGYNDAGRYVTEAIYADVFGAEAALVRAQLISGTHALSTALFSHLEAGDELVSATGKPYNTLQTVIGLRKTKGSLLERGVVYKQADLIGGEKVDFNALKALITPKTRMVEIQRSKGYLWRHSFTVPEIAEIIAFVKSIRKDILVLVDDCYGEFVCENEPSESGADMTAGSLIKNPGGGLAPVGGYIAGTKECVEAAAYRLTVPGMGREVGPSLGVTPSFLQGLFLAPSVVASAVKGAVLAANVFGGMGFGVLPGPGEPRADIVQAVQLGSAEAVLAFCRAAQKAAPVDSFVTPEPWDMPGYGCGVVMAAGAFVQGSSIELSADAPVAPPYNVFWQGGLTFPHAKLGVMFAADALLALKK